MNERIELTIDIFEKTGQVAHVLKTLTIRQLIEEILREFDEYLFLDLHTPSRYTLYKKGESEPLDPKKTIAEYHLSPGTELVFQERPPIVRSDVSPIVGNVYLREKKSGRVFKLEWQPAIIGRPDNVSIHNDLPNNLLAVNMQSFETGEHVSRRHAIILEEKGHYFIESKSQNPTLLNGNPDPISQREELHDGDEIHLIHSQITLRFMVRST